MSLHAAYTVKKCFCCCCYIINWTNHESEKEKKAEPNKEETERIISVISTMKSNAICKLFTDWKGNFVEFSVVVILCTVISVRFLCCSASLSTVMYCEFWQFWSCSSFPLLSISAIFFHIHCVPTMRLSNGNPQKCMFDNSKKLGWSCEK